MKKILIVVISLFLLVGCSLGNNPKNSVKEYLMKYQNNDDDVISQIDRELLKDEYTESQKEKYKDILKKQYTDLKYKIIEEVIDGDNATVTVEITVYDLYRVQKDASDYMASHLDEFNDNSGAFSKELYLDYKLDKMKKTSETVTYTLSFTLNRTDDEWLINNLDETTLEKIHGVYSY